MCYRFFLKAADLKKAASKLGAALEKEFGTRRNIAPSTRIPGLRRKPSGPGREWVSLQWGLVPHWGDETALRSAASKANARAESLLEKPSFADLVRKRRCIIPASGFFEWETLPSGTKQPWLFSRADGAPLFFAGLWDSWLGADGQTLESCTLVTTQPNERLARIHDRMPVLLEEENCPLWLDSGPEGIAACLRLLVPCPSDRLAERPVDPWLNNPAHDDERCIAAYTPPPRTGEEQLGLSLD